MEQTIKDRVLDLARQGVSYYEIERTLGVQHAVASKWARNAGIKRGRGGGCVAKNNVKRASDNAAKRIEVVRKALEGRFDVVRETHRNWFVLRCTSCGNEFERFVDLKYNTVCPECQRADLERREEERKVASMRRTVLRVLIKLANAKEREEQRDIYLDEPHVCKECGRTFTVRELQQDNPWNHSNKPTFCSLSCSNRFHGRQARHRRRESEQHGDCKLSLRELDERCNHTCYLCGGRTDWDDYRIDESGNFIAGDMYPSMDHVVPISRGGKHTQENIMLAHKLCNSLKGDRTIEEARKAIALRFDAMPG